MKTNYFIVAVLFPVFLAMGQTNVFENAVATNLPPITVTASRTVRPIQETPAIVSRIDARGIGEASYRSTPEILRDDPAIRVQKTSQGQGSPYIRGFTGFKTLMLVDGIRLNNSVFRSGANQYWATVDCYSLAALEVLKGPSSVLYGSDAVGGTVQALTYEPDYAAEGSIDYGTRLFTRLSSAERSVIGRAEGEVATSTSAVHAGFTYKNFGDLEGGKHVGRQQKTGYQEYDYDIKAKVKLAGDRELVLAYQNVDQYDVWRTHKTIYGVSWHGTTIGTDLYRDFDQTRRLGYAQFRDNEQTLLYDSMRFTVFCQQQLEDQYASDKNSKKTWDGFDVVTPGVNLELQKETGYGTFVYGLDYSRDLVNAYNHGVSSSLIQGPVADDSNYDLAGIYVEDRIPIGSRFELTPGVRGTYAHAGVGDYYEVGPGGTVYPNGVVGSPFSKYWLDASANVRLSYFATEDKSLMFYNGLGQAFRAPNLSDLSSYRASKTKTQELPSPDVDPEHYLTYEIGSKYSKNGFSLQTAWYYTRMRDMIASTYEGTDPIFARSDNASDGYVQGAEVEAAYEIDRHWVVRGGIAWSEGYADTPVNATTYIRDDNYRTAPLAGFAALRWRTSDKRFFAEFYNEAVDSEDRLSASEAAGGDTSRVSKEGTAGYYVAGIRTGYQVTKNLNVGFMIDNILDKDYRVHGSGSNEAGRNFILTTDLRF